MFQNTLIVSVVTSARHYFNLSFSKPNQVVLTYEADTVYIYYDDSDGPAHGNGLQGQ